MNLTNPYWRAPTEYNLQKFDKPISNSRGFLFNLPHRQPVTAGYYYGQNQPQVNTRKPQIVTDSRPEYYSVQNIIPTTGGRPLIDIKSKEMTFDRRKFTKYI